MICSVSEVPERGIPTTKMGFVEAEAPPSIVESALARIDADHVVGEAAMRFSIICFGYVFSSSLPRW